MKNLKKLSFILACGLAITAVFAGCTDSKSNSGSSDVQPTTRKQIIKDGKDLTYIATVIGNWKTQKIVNPNGNLRTLAEYAEEAKVKEDSVMMTFNFTEDNTVSVFIGGKTFDSTYTFDGKTLTYIVPSTGKSSELMYNPNDNTLSYIDEEKDIINILGR